MQLAEYTRQRHADEVDRLGKKRFNYLIQRNCATAGSRLHCRREEAGVVEMVALPCKSWSCGHCSRLLRGRLVEAVQQAIGQHGLDLFVTFTLCKRGACDTRAEVKRISKAWRSFTRQYKRKYGMPLVYMRFLEIKDGWPHYHVLTKDLPRRWAKDMWHHYTGAHQVDSSPIEDPAVVADYATKFIHINSRRYGKIRWYGGSLGVDLKIRDKAAGGDAGWMVVHGALTEASCRSEGAEVVAWDHAGRPKRAVIKPTKSPDFVPGTGSDPTMPCDAEQSGAAHPHDGMGPGADTPADTGGGEGGAHVPGV